MKQNMGSTDKLIRLVVAAIIVILFVLGVIKLNSLGIILLIVAGLMVVTSLVGFCPLYPVLKINTLLKKK